MEQEKVVKVAEKGKRIRGGGRGGEGEKGKERRKSRGAEGTGNKEIR